MAGLLAGGVAMRQARVLSLLLLGLACAAAAPSTAVAVAPSTPTITPAAPATSSGGNSTGLITEFVQRSGTRFVVQAANGQADSCQTFYFAGANAQFLMVFAADPLKRQYVLEILDSAQQLGLSVLRMWTFADGPTTFNALQRYPGQYDEGTLSGLDYVLNEASLRGIRVVLVFANYWSQYGGVDQYNVWSFQAGTGTCNGDSTCRDEFFSDPMAAQYYRDHVKTILTRTNSINGRLYREDPTIFGYNLMNEPRSQQDLYLVQRVTTDALQTPYNLSYNQGNDLQQWIEDMAGYVKSIDPIHLLTIGSEGFAGNYTPMYLYANPGAWGSLLGVDFVRNHLTTGLDYATMHVYVDQWLCVAEGATEEGQLSFMNEWLDAHQQAAEEDLVMPVVLEEFGSKLNARSGQYSTAYDSCLASAQRGGGCAGVMFWDLTHEGYSLVDPWLDGQLRFGGGYSNWLNTTDPDRLAILDMASSYASSVAKINNASQGTDTCVYYAPPALGQGCKNLDVALELGGLPWTCLQGEPTGLNWCNAVDANSIYRDPPQAWLSTNGRELPYNTIEGLILGNLTNNGSTPINLNGAWLIVPYSMGVQTQFEGIWEQITDPNSYFTVYCWYINGNGQDLCDGGIDVSFTNFTWPVGTKRDRGVNITFTADIILQPGGSINTQGGNTQVLISFKDATNAFRLDVSDMGIDGASNCPNDLEFATYPPPNPPAPIPCTQGPTPNRGCPNLEWYFNSQTANTSTVATSSITSAGRRLQQNTGGSTDGTSGEILADPPVSIVNPGPVPGNPINVTTAPLTNVFSISAPVNATSVGFTAGTQYIITAHIASMGNPRVTELVSPLAGTTATNAADTPHTDALGDGSNVLGTTVYLIMSFEPAGFTSPVYRVLAGGQVPSNDPSGGYFKGVFELDWNSTVSNVQFFAESPLAGLQVTLTDVALTAPALVSTQPNKLPLPAVNMTDEYSPCVLPQNAGNDGIFVVNLPAGQSDTLNAALCSPGGYYQSVRVYNAGKEILRTDPGGVPATYALNNIKIAGGSDYVFVIMGSVGDPYGSYRGQPGIRLTWASGRAFDGTYDAQPVNISQFVRVDDGQLMLGCDRAAYVGCNTWDLMDKSRYESNRPEVESRMDAMVQAGWSVGRTWGFSLGDGTGETALGETVLDPNSVLEIAPGVYNEEVWESLDFVLANAAQRGLRLIIPIEDYWLSIDRYINWSATAVTKNDFYTDYTIRQLYKDHLKTYVNRVNSINNRTYSEDPTIYAWDLLNEPRCTGCGYALQTWLEEMSVYMKAIDPNHMVGLGSEGFYSTTCDRVYLNPGAGARRTGISSSPWASQEGQDFLANAVVPDIDFATTHIWMDNWLGYADFSTCLYCDLNFDYTHGGNLWEEKLDYTVSWLQAHIQDAGQLGKPLVTEEFGKAIAAAKVFTGELPNSPEQGETICANDSIRDIFFQTIYGMISESAQANGPAQGSNFWNLYTVGIADDDPYKVTLADNSTMAIVALHQANISAVTARPGTCPAPYNAATSVVFDTASGPASGEANQNTTTQNTAAVPPSMTGLTAG